MNSMKISNFHIDENIYNINDLDKLLIDVKFIKTNKKIEYANVSCAFDIETSSFYRRIDNKEKIINHKPTEKELKYYEKCNTMYAFVLGINGKCIIGRTWEEFCYLLNKISEHYNLNENRRMIFYVHNLPYEFQYIRKFFNWQQVFAVDERSVVECDTYSGISFRCSYALSGYSLSKLGNELTKYKVQKMVGDLDYSKIRHSKTPLTEKEIHYILNDGLVVMAYIQEKIENDGNITKIPLTKTGYVRKYCRNECLYGGGGSHKKSGLDYIKYHKIMSFIKIKDVDEYKQLKRAFHGGFTHANACYSGITMHDVTSYDFTSSYPYCMVALKEYPMSNGRIVKIKSREDFEKYIKYFCCLFDVKFYNLKSKTYVEHPLSESKCIIKGKALTDNGRIVECDEASTTLTEKDYLILHAFYKWDKMKINNFRIYRKGYLPTKFVKAILKLYSDKTKLKGLEDEESMIHYAYSKGLLNATFGMSVTDICRVENIYQNDEWITNLPDYQKCIDKYNNQKNRFLCYQWGIWTTSNAMYNLFTGIKEFGKDYIYSDTDSIKAVNIEEHIDYINNYNKRCIEKLKKASEYHKLDLSLFIPKTINGEEKPLGVWDFDGHYKSFKCLRAKAYLVEDDKGKLKLTNAGLNKKIAVKYIEDVAKLENKSPFDVYKDELYIPPKFTGKNIHTYLDNEQKGIIIDYLGNKSTFHELSSIHMEEADYSLNLTDEYLNFILGAQTKYE